jgi:hypothetical protein
MARVACPAPAPATATDSHRLQERLGADLLRDLLLQERGLRFLQQRLRMNADQTTRERTVETSWIRI